MVIATFKPFLFTSNLGYINVFLVFNKFMYKINYLIHIINNLFGIKFYLDIVECLKGEKE
jgi:hypothetical protein